MPKNMRNLYANLFFSNLLWEDQYNESDPKGSLWCEVYHILGSF